MRKDKNILRVLQSLTNAEDISLLIENNNSEDLFAKNSSTAVLVATWLGKESILGDLLENGASVNVADEGGR